MKKFVSAFVPIILFLFLPIINSYSQWEPDVRLTYNINSSQTSHNYARCVAASGDVVHVVWYDNRDGFGNNEIYCKRSPDGGLSWGADIRLTNQSASSENPSVSVSGSLIHVVWQDNRDGNVEIYYKRSTDGGLSWGTDTRLTNNSSAMFPSITVSGSIVHVVWQDFRNGNYEIYYKRSPDGGISWGADTRLTNASEASEFPSVSVSGSLVNVVWHDNRNGGIPYREIYYKRSMDGGLSWEADTRLTNSPSTASYPSIAVYDLAVHIAWQDERDGNPEVYYIYSTDGGVSWGTDTRLTNTSFESGIPSISVSGSLVYIAWLSNRDGNFEIYTKHSTNAGVSFGTDIRLTTNTGDSFYPSISVSGQIVHLVWQDHRDGNDEVYYKRDPTGGNPIGIINMNSEIPNHFSLSQNYPNPFNPTTNFEFQIAKSGFVNLTIYDATGREVETLVNEELKSGTYKADWDATNFVSGVYFYRLTTSDFTETKKMVLMK